MNFCFKVNPFVFVLMLLIFYDALTPYVVALAVELVCNMLTFFLLLNGNDESWKFISAVLIEFIIIFWVNEGVTIWLDV